MSRAQTQERRLEIYRLHLAGLSEDDIAQRVRIDRSAVSRHLERVRELNPWIGRSHRQLYTEITREAYDASRQTRQEAYRILFDPANQNRPEVKLSALSRIQATISLLADLRPDLDALGVWEQIDEIKQAIASKRLADKILPTGKHGQNDRQVAEPPAEDP